MTNVSGDKEKLWLKSTLKVIKNIINNQTFLVGDPEKYEPVTQCVDVYKAKLQSDGSLDKLNLEFWLEEICRIRNYLEILGHQQPT